MFFFTYFLFFLQIKHGKFLKSTIKPALKHTVYIKYPNMCFCIENKHVFQNTNCDGWFLTFFHLFLYAIQIFYNGHGLLVWYLFEKKEKNTSSHLGVVADEEINCSACPSKVTLPTAVRKELSLPRPAPSAFRFFIYCEMLIVCTLMGHNV